MKPTEHKIINFLQRFVENYGYSPSISEIMLGIGHKSKGTIHRYLNQMVDQGILSKTSDAGRNTYIYVDKHDQCIPMLGRIAAGIPIEAVQESDQLNFFDRFTDDGLYQLEIKGDSMIDIGICEGDIVLIKPTQKAYDRQIVVALIDNSDATLKRYYNRGKHVELFSENKKYPPQVYLSDRVTIQGVLHSVHKFHF